MRAQYELDHRVLDVHTGWINMQSKAVITVYTNANSDTHLTPLPPLIGQQRHRQSTYLAVCEFLLRWEFSVMELSSFTRVLARYMRRAYLVAEPRRSVAQLSIKSRESPRADILTRSTPGNQLSRCASGNWNFASRNQLSCCAAGGRELSIKICINCCVKKCTCVHV